MVMHRDLSLHWNVAVWSFGRPTNLCVLCSLESAHLDITLHQIIITYSVSSPQEMLDGMEVIRYSSAVVNWIREWWNLSWSAYFWFDLIFHPFMQREIFWGTNRCILYQVIPNDQDKRRKLWTIQFSKKSWIFQWNFEVGNIFMLMLLLWIAYKKIGAMLNFNLAISFATLLIYRPNNCLIG